MQFPSCVITGIWYNTMIFSRLHGSVFEDYFTTSERDRYNLMRSIETHEGKLKYINYKAITYGGIPIP